MLQSKEGRNEPSVHPFSLTEIKTSKMSGTPQQNPNTNECNSWFDTIKECIVQVQMRREREGGERKGEREELEGEREGEREKASSDPISPNTTSHEYHRSHYGPRWSPSHHSWDDTRGTACLKSPSFMSPPLKEMLRCGTKGFGVRER